MFALIAALVCGTGCVAMQSAAPPAQTPPSTQPTPVPPTTTPRPPSDGLPPAQVGTTASGGSISVNGSLIDSLAPLPVARDSTPTADAMAVLNSIPDPLGRKTREPAPAARPEPTTTSPRPAAATSPTSAPATPAIAPDTSNAPAPVQADSAGVPTPEPTQPLGDRPGSRVMIPDSLLTPASGSSAPAQPPAAAAQPAPSAAPTSPDSCWRVQFAAKPERARSERLMAAAQSQLDLPMVIVREKGLYKVRTRDCMNETAAEALKKRAIAAGFDGSFKLRNP